MCWGGRHKDGQKQLGACLVLGSLHSQISQFLGSAQPREGVTSLFWQRIKRCYWVSILWRGAVAACSSPSLTLLPRMWNLATDQVCRIQGTGNWTPGENFSTERGRAYRRTTDEAGGLLQVLLPRCHKTDPLLRVPIVAQRVTNPNNIHKDAGSIPGLTQWVNDLTLP